MLKSLEIHNYALIDGLQMSPDAALSMITGETGAGKSIMLGAIGLLLGNRADTKVLFDEEKKCVIEGVFDIQQYDLKALFDQEELDYDQHCIIRREIAPSGKSRAFINDTPVLLDTLKTIGSKLMDVHSQHDTLQLGSNEYQLEVIDTFAQNQSLLNDYQQAYRSYKKAEKAYNDLVKSAADMQKEADFNRFQFEELDAAKLQADEQESLESQLNLLENAEEIKRKLAESTELLEGENLAAIDLIRRVVDNLQQLSNFGPTYQQLFERINSAYIELKDISIELVQAEESMEVDFEQTEEMRQRLSTIYQLQKKHGVLSVADLISLRDQLDEKLQQVENLEEDLLAKKKAKEAAYETTIACGQKLSKARTEHFAKFTDQIEKLLHELGMENAQMQVQHQTIAPSASGLDEIAILFTANKGMKPQPLKAVASGGEFSRLMFCVKYILADKKALPTLIFDEIDTGISGEIALKMVRMMRQIAQKLQVICITHLPQVAAKGAVHYFVYKDNSQAKTISKIKRLSESERIQEIAQMIGGAQPTDSAYQSAKELLEIS